MARLSALGLLALLSFSGLVRGDDDSAEAFFESKIRPVLATDCLSCHGARRPAAG